MFSPAPFLALALTTILPLVLSNGVPIHVSPGLNVSTNPNITAHLPPCTNLTYTNAPTIPCYTKLQVTSYLKNFNSTIAEVCSPIQLWSQCLLLSVYNVPGVNCTMTSNTTSTCTPFDCATLNSTACPQPAPSTFTNITTDQAQGWYGVWNVYSVHHFLTAWATALNTTSSEKAILGVINPRVANTATTVLTSLVSKYGLNPNADAAMVKLAQVKIVKPEPQYGNRHSKGQSSNPTGAQWRAILYAKMQSVSDLAAGNFTDFIGMGGEGDFSVRGLAGVDALVDSLKNGTKVGG